MAEALDAADGLAADGVVAAVASVTTLRPFPATAIRELAAAGRSSSPRRNPWRPAVSVRPPRRHSAAQVRR
ncbi:hypothetical protein ACFQ10_50825 [Streptomyces indonesiensis]